MLPALVLVTRPGPEGRQLVAALRDAGLEALAWPAFDLVPVADAAAPAPAVLPDVDLAIFVSPAAARFAAPLLPALRDVARLAAVGAGTRAAVVEAFGIDADRVLAPDGPGGSEALFPLLLAEGAGAPRRVLVVRAQEGREWLADRLAAAGVAVSQLAVYRREARCPTGVERREVEARARRGGRPALVVTSSAAVAPLEAGFARLAGVADWLHGGLAIANHPRIAEALRAAGYREVACCEPAPGPILDLLAAG